MYFTHQHLARPDLGFPLSSPPPIAFSTRKWWRHHAASATSRISRSGRFNSWCAMAVVSFVIYGAVMGGYDITITRRVLLGVLYVGWMLLFVNAAASSTICVSRRPGRPNNIVRLIGMQDNQAQQQQRTAASVLGWRVVFSCVFAVCVMRFAAPPYLLSLLASPCAVIHRRRHESNDMTLTPVTVLARAHDGHLQYIIGQHERPLVAIHSVRSGHGRVKSHWNVSRNSGKGRRTCGRTYQNPRKAPTSGSVMSFSVRRSALSDKVLNQYRPLSRPTGDPGRSSGQRQRQDHDAQDDVGVLCPGRGAVTLAGRKYPATAHLLQRRGMRYSDAEGLCLSDTIADNIRGVG